MGIFAHLRELRKRLLLSIAGIVLGTVPGWYLYDPVMQFIQGPVKATHNGAVSLNFQTIGAAFDLKLTVAIWTAILLTSPWWICQIGIFVAPALKRKEKIYLAVFGLVGVVLFSAGALSGIWLAPRAVEILQSFVPEGAVSLLQANTYVLFYMRLVIAFGISFLIPELLVVLNFLGVMSARTMLSGWRWATVSAFVFAAIANPLPSPWPMTIQALLLLTLYLVAVGISWLRDRYVHKKQSSTHAS
ncbi:twin-arginine translocase subunit TatC [Arcanobacterium phocisimile]|uniref:Sec-independent protein translocase protein TatC n=2 Tax=Arcanobacterium phocisimile TaxID=1302235 RepID=A0ABX7IMP0_9ACTO|nr:twin-arginine translocase subunit TatC [Arcanobacterium phocisimile]QRV03053.1 twin-arginine translocase subunit TatC [Arcanobacterium phocisimile]